MFIGRDYELKQIKEKLEDRSESHLIILYGRRRVGKSTLIHKSIRNQKNILFFEGIQGAHTKDQIDHFLTELSRQTGRIKLAAMNWREVFQGLSEIIETGRWTLVFDELPWMANGRSGLISDLKFYWDKWAQKKNVVLFLCGSVASFMVKHLIHSTALHNRKSLEIHLMPLTPHETGQFIPKRSLREKSQLYMTFGGVPKYLEQINPNESLSKNINRLCFSSNCFFINEFNTLFKEQFKIIKSYENLCQLLAYGPQNISDISEKVGIRKGGGLKDQLDNLIRANLIRAYHPYTANHRPRIKTKQYKLIDPFLIFYFRYMKDHKQLIQCNKNENLFRSIAADSISQYYGFAFERLCEDSLLTILGKLDLSLGDLHAFGPFFQRYTDRTKGVQIDNLLMRRDDTWTVIEYKYTKSPIGMTVVHEVQEKIKRLPKPNHITIETALISASGVTKAVQNSRFFNHILTLSDIL